MLFLIAAVLLPAQNPPESAFPRIQKIADNVYTYEALVGRPGDRYTTNSMFVVTNEGVLVADGQGSVAETKRMVEEIGKITSQPIRYVVVCSDHGDHTNGNSAFPSGTEFIAHPTSKATIERQASAPNRRADAPAVIVPTTVVSDRRVLTLGGMEIDIRFLGRAHTGGDLVVYLPKDKILFMSEIYLNRLFPGMRSAYPSEWMDVFKKARTMDVAMYVPGHGYISDAATLKNELAAYEKATADVIAEAKRLHAAGLSPEEAAKQAKWGPYSTWSGASSQGTIAIRRIYEELEGKLK
jgi:glyoxylase-like metal-dependent hydrolase (beta-lactamase superfamily II)